VTPFGAFVDVGLKNDGLVHVSELSLTERHPNPFAVVAIGQAVRASVLGVDLVRRHLSLSIRIAAAGQGQGGPAREFAAAERSGGGGVVVKRQAGGEEAGGPSHKRGKPEPR